MKALFPIVSLFNVGGDHYNFKWSALCFIGYGYLLVRIAKEKSIYLAAMLGYCLFSSMYVGIFKGIPYLKASPNFYNEVLTTIVYLSSAIFVLLYSKPREIGRLFKYFIPISCAYTLLLQYTPFEPMMYNTTVQASLLSLMLPFCITPLNIVLTLVAIIATKSSVGLGAVCLSMSLYYFMKAKNKIIYTGILGVTAVAIYFVADYVYAADLFNLSGRGEAWRISWELIKNTPWLGTGNGTFSHIVPAIQSLNTNTEQLFLWAHNDYIQMLVENGIIGVLLGLAVCTEVVVIARKHAWMLAYVAAWMINSFGNFPNHLADQSLLTIIFLSLVYKQRRLL